MKVDFFPDNKTCSIQSDQKLQWTSWVYCEQDTHWRVVVCVGRDTGWRTSHTITVSDTSWVLTQSLLLICCPWQVAATSCELLIQCPNHKETGQQVTNRYSCSIKAPVIYYVSIIQHKTHIYFTTSFTYPEWHYFASKLCFIRRDVMCPLWDVFTILQSTLLQPLRFLICNFSAAETLCALSFLF